MQTINTNNIDPTKPIVALTFDDGPSEYTSRILDTLQKHGGRVSFFVDGIRIAENKSKVIRAHLMDCEVLCHAWDHPDLTTLSADEIKKQITDTMDAIETVINNVTNIFRPPYGYINKTVIKVAEELGLALVNWSVDPNDWDTDDVDKILDYIMSNVTDGDIVLCHDLYDSTAKAMSILIPELIAQGYQLVTVSELLQYKYGDLEPGVLYPK